MSGSSLGDICILVPTYGECLWLALETQRLIGLWWKDHPPIYFCGVAGDADPYLPLVSDPGRWVDVAEDAVKNLRARGYRKCYLILDDHPPMGPCHAGHLNATIPRLMDELGAVYIGLQGWDHKRQVKGSVLEGERLCRLLRMPAAFTSRFGLHPALWDLEALDAMLSTMRHKISPPAKTPWDFERLSGDRTLGWPASWADACYRIHGRSMACGGVAWMRIPETVAGFQRDLHEFIHFLTSPKTREFVAVKFGVTQDRMKALKIEVRKFFRRFHYDAEWVKRCTRKKIRKALEEIFGFNDVLYKGPYPLYFTGVLRRGGVNPYLVRYIRRKHKPEFRPLLEGISARSQVPAQKAED